jgi:hypothetical protein
MPFDVLAIGEGAADLFGGAAAADAGIAAGAELAGGFTAADIAAGTVSVSDALAAGATAGDLLSAGVPVGDLLAAGIPVSDLTAAGATAEQIASATPYLESAAEGGIPDWASANAQAAAQEAAQTGAYNIPSTSPTSLAQLLGYAKSGAQLIGGIGQLAGGVGAMQAGQAAGKLAGQADPYAAYRSQAAAQLQNLLMNPSTITTTPGYQFNLQQGLQAQQAQQAAQGRLVSGGGLLQAQQFGQQYATSSLQQQQALLAQLSGATQAPASGAIAQGNLLAGQIGGTLGGAQALASGTQNVINPLASLYAQYNQQSPTPA